MNNLNLDFLKGIIPCGTGANPAICTVCDFFKLIQNIINFFLFVSAPLITLGAVYIGFLFLFSGGSPKIITDAKSKLWLLIWGTIWILGSWLVLNTILSVVANPRVFPTPWNKIQCQVTSQVMPSEQASPNQPPSSPLPKAALGEQEARNQLQQCGIPVNKNPCPSGVKYQNVPGGCTSLEGVSASTIGGACQLKNDCNCNLIVTGGTELGHGTGYGMGHTNGLKLDFGVNPTLDQYIQSNFTNIGLRSDDGAMQYRAPNGTIYAKESNPDHWDVKFAQ